MTPNLRALTHGAVAMAALGIAFGACAQSSQSSLAKEIGDAGPQAGKSFIDLSVGKATYSTSCGSEGSRARSREAVVAPCSAASSEAGWRTG